MTDRSKVAFLVAAVSLSSCDPGKRTVARLVEENRLILESGITEENARNAQVFAGALKAMIAAHPDEGSGEAAKEALTKLRSKAAERKFALESDLAEKSKAIHEPATKVNDQLLAFRKNAKPIAKSFGDPIRLKEGECLMDDPSGEFDENPQIQLTFHRVVKVGKEQALLEQIFGGGANEALVARGNPKKEPQVIELALAGGHSKVNCAKLEEVMAQHAALIEASAPAERIRQQLSKLDSILSESLI